MNLTAKVASAGVVALAGFVAPKITSAGWKMVTGKEPPRDDDESKLTQLIVFAAVSAVLATVVQYYATKGAAKLTDKNPKEIQA